MSHLRNRPAPCQLTLHRQPCTGSCWEPARVGLNRWHGEGWHRGQWGLGSSLKNPPSCTALLRLGIPQAGPSAFAFGPANGGHCVARPRVTPTPDKLKRDDDDSVRVTEIYSGESGQIYEREHVSSLRASAVAKPADGLTFQCILFTLRLRQRAKYF